MTGNNYILGGGFVGLILGLYTKATIITNKISGNFENIKPFYIYSNKYTKLFLEKLNIKYTERKVHVGYIYESHNTNEVDVFSYPDSEFKKRYYLRSRINSTAEITESVMNSGKTQLLVLDFDHKEMINKLISNNNIIVDTITSINTTKKQMTGSKLYNYNKLFVTIPACIFYSLTEFKNIINNNFKYSSKYYIKSKHKDIDLKKFEFAYNTCDKFKWDRIIKDGEYYYYEYNKIPETKENEQLIPIKIGQILSKNTITLLDSDIKFIGRYAEWNHSIRTTEVIKKCIKYGK